MEGDGAEVEVLHSHLVPLLRESAHIKPQPRESLSRCETWAAGPRSASSSTPGSCVSDRIHQQENNQHGDEHETKSSDSGNEAMHGSRK